MLRRSKHEILLQVGMGKTSISGTLTKLFADAMGATGITTGMNRSPNHS